MTLLRLREVDTYYGEIHILQNVSLEVGKGELVCLLGGNASGKSTTLKTILGLVSPRSGTVEIDGEDVRRRLEDHAGHAFLKRRHVCLGKAGLAHGLDHRS